MADDDLDALLNSALDDFEANRGPLRPMESSTRDADTSDVPSPVAKAPPAAAPVAGPVRPPAAGAPGAPSPDDFLRMLSTGDDEAVAKALEDMTAAFMRAEGPDGGAGSESVPSMAAFQEMLQKMALENPDAEEDDGPEGTVAVEAPASQVDREADEFKRTIAETLSMLDKNLSETPKVSADGSPLGADGEPAEDAVNKLFEQLAGLGENADFEKAMEDLVAQMFAKDVLYPAMKSLHDKFPAFLAEKKPTLPADEQHRFEQQFVKIRQICAIYESDEEDTAAIVQLVQDLQDHGQPPVEIVQAVSAELEAEGKEPTPFPPHVFGGGAAADGPPGCPTQ